MNPDLEAEIKREVPADDSTSHGEKMLLHSLIREFKPQVVVETGTHKGLTTLYLADAVHQNGFGHVYTADPNVTWNAPGNFRKFPELEKLITYIPDRGSTITVPTSIDFLFIDGFHEDYEVLEEWEKLAPQLSKTAIVVFHDCWYGNTDGVNEAVEKLGLHSIWLPTKNAIRIYVKHPEKPESPEDL